MNIPPEELSQESLEWKYRRVGTQGASTSKSIMAAMRVAPVMVSLAPGVTWTHGEKAIKSAQDKVVAYLQEHGSCLKSSLAKQAGVSASPIATLIKENFLSVQTQEASPFDLLPAGAQSRINDICTELKNGEPLEFDLPAFQHGHKYEPEARKQFEFNEKTKVKEAGLIFLSKQFPEHPYGDMITASVDGLVGDDANLEIKCPKNPARHNSCFTFDLSHPSHPVNEYFDQMQHQMYVTGRRRCHFVSFVPHWSIDRIFHTIVERDDKYIDRLASRLMIFCKILKEKKREQNLPDFLPDLDNGSAQQDTSDLPEDIIF